MAGVKLEEEQELWEQEGDHSVVREVKEEPEIIVIQSLEEASSVLQCQKEAEEVEIKAEPLPQFLHVSVKSEEGEPQSSLLHQTVTEEDRADTDAAGAEQDKLQHSEDSEGTDDSEAQMNIAREGNKDQKHDCPFCGKEFKYFCNLARHQRVHTGEKPFKCTVCQKDFINRYSLDTHMRTHTGEKPFQCSICKKTFTQRVGLERHMKSKHKDKTEEFFKCSICTKGFKEKQSLKLHMKTHNPLKCTICSIVFSGKNLLENHMMIHTGEKPFKCSVCGIGFIQWCTKKRHENICKLDRESALKTMLAAPDKWL